MTVVTSPLDVERAPPVSPQSNHAAVWERCADSLHRYFAVRLRAHAALADDLMQQLWLRIRQRGDDVRGDDAEPWLWQVARNLLREHWRKSAGAWERRLQIDPAIGVELARRFESEALPDELLAREETRQALLLALSALRAEDQELLIGAYFEDRTHADLAQQLNISERGVEGRLYRARLALREKLGHIADD